MLFTAELTDFKIIYNVLNAISFKEYAIFRPMDQGLKVTIEEMKCVETSAYIPANMFSHYYIDPDSDIRFKISLKVFTECLHIYGDDGNPSLKLCYQEIGSPLCIVIKHSEENITTDCEIKTLDVDEFTELSLADECSLNKIVMDAGVFVEILSDLDNTSDELELKISPDPPYFRVITNSIMGQSVVEISKNSEMVAIFQCTSESKSQYAFSNIRQILKVMNFSRKISISTGESGLLGMQLFIIANEKQMYIEYYVSSLFGED